MPPRASVGLISAQPGRNRTIKPQKFLRLQVRLRDAVRERMTRLRQPTWIRILAVVPMILAASLSAAARLSKGSECRFGQKAANTLA
jgi:hypothetical protein